ncbi:MAG TPA: cysteine peptidase family C39 domain-containing protein, partial [Ktedonobacteraceae bacterium]|nr:cysteine peptidase family C39 domain-containing protein [Ktedonobacteraceae bacterium]
MSKTNKKQQAILPPTALPGHAPVMTEQSTVINTPVSALVDTGKDEQPLVRILPRSPHDAKQMYAAQATRRFRWEQQTERYPAELLQLMESDTNKMRALEDQPAPAVRSRKKRRKKRRRVPEMRQMTAVECGAACIAMILNYYGYAASITEVLDRCGVGRDGLTALEIVKSTRLYGLRVRAVSLDLEDFRFVTLPAIVHWEFNHFLIVERWSRKRIEVVDPALGRRTLTHAEFDEGFTGVAIMLEPGAQFEQRAPQKSLTPWSYMRSFLRMRAIIFQILGTSLLLQMLGLAAPFLTEVIIDRILPGKDANLLRMLALGMLILILMQGVTAFLRSSLLIYLQTRIDTNMMLNFFEHMLSLPYRFFQLRLSGDLLARMNSNLAIRDLLTNQLISTLLDGGTVVTYFIILLFLSKLVAGIALGIGIVQAALLLVTSSSIRRLTQRDLEAQGKTQGYMNEVLSGIATIKAAGAEHRAFNRWENLFFNEMNVSLRLSYLSSIVGTI